MRTRRACKLLATMALAALACTTTSDPAPAGPPQHESGPPPAPAPTPAPQPGPGIGQACASGVCASGLECVEYYGIAGPSGPKFTSCEIRCQGGAACPGGMSCVTVADGPGAVCRPTEHAAPAPTPPPSPAARGETCGAGVACAAGLTCIEYYGIAGPRGPKFASCEQRCITGKASSCPSGLTCTTIADGPGPVCRASAASAPAPAPAPAPSTKPGMGEACGENGACADGLTCLDYYGVAGAQGPKFSSCEMRCTMIRPGKLPPKGKFAGACPKGSICTTISDGPGTVCRPTDGVKSPGPGRTDRPIR